MTIIQRDRSVIPACDFDLDTFRKVVEATADIGGIGAYKIGPALTGRPGYDAVVKVAREHTDKPLIFDAQKWGTDIPDTAEGILTPVKESGIDAVILFPQSGPATEYGWITAARNLGLGVIVGGEMTHPRYLDNNVDEGKKQNYSVAFKSLGFDRDIPGFLRSSAPTDMYGIAARMDVTDFVVPGNKPNRITIYRGIIETGGVDAPVFYSPGLVAQGGEISEGAKAAGERFHAIVGRGIYKAENIREAAIELTSQL